MQQKKMYAFLIIVLLSTQQINTNHNTKSIFISLGIRCLAAAQLKNHGLRLASYPFDWLDTDFDSLCNLLQNDFVDFLAKENLQLGHSLGFLLANGSVTVLPIPHILDTKYHIAMRHDFDFNPNFLEKYDLIKQKYDRRIKRFYDTLNSGQHIYFIRHLLTYQQALVLTEILNNKFPNLDYTLIAIDYSEEIKTPWNIPHVKNFYFGTPEDSWEELFADKEGHWKKVFQELLSSNQRVKHRFFKQQKNWHQLFKKLVSI